MQDPSSFTQFRLSAVHSIVPRRTTENHASASLYREFLRSTAMNDVRKCPRQLSSAKLRGLSDRIAGIHGDE